MKRVARPIVVACVLASLASGCANVKRFLYEGFGRDGWQRPEEVIRALEIQPGQRVADLGAGGGYFTFRLADALGAGGIVYAVDVDEDMIDYLRARTREEGRGNVEVVAARFDDPLLPEPVDVIFTCNTYHHIEDRPAYFARAARYLRPGGRIAIVELNGSGWFASLFGHYTAPDEIRDEMSNAGYRRIAAYDFLARQSFQIFATGASTGRITR
jgi:ubiquinone/menaquinone biosynthesis C-methylase UbiE